MEVLVPVYRYEYLLIIIILCTTFSQERESIWEFTDLEAISYFESIEKYYQYLHQEQKSESPPKETIQPMRNVQIKQDICRNVFSSRYFDMFEEEWVNTNLKETREELKKYYPRIFSSIYKEYKNLCMSLPLAGSSNNCFTYKYGNDYKLRSISVGGVKTEEYVFECLARDRQSNKIKEYFISQEYNVNSVNTYPIAGRFIFVFDNRTSGNELVIRALAEEPAIGWDFMARFAEIYYVNNRDKDKSNKTLSMEEDPICQLTAVGKLRLCTSLFASSLFKDKVKFLPSSESVQTDCEKKQISFNADLIESASFIDRVTRWEIRENGKNIYEEWMIGCKALTIDKNYKIIYYVSRGDYSNSVFVYNHKLSDRRVFVYNYFNNTSVV